MHTPGAPQMLVHEVQGLVLLGQVALRVDTCPGEEHRSGCPVKVSPKDMRRALLQTLPYQMRVSPS